MNKQIRKITVCALFTAVICVCAQISIPLPSGVAITLQTFGAALVGFSLGAKLAFVCTALYIAIGALGIPVFSSFSGGFGVLLGYSGGFLWFLPAFAALCGLCFYVNQKKIKFLCLFAAIFLLHLCGVLWFSKFSGNSIFTSILSVSIIYLPKDVLSLTAAHFIAVRIRKIL